MLDAMVRIAAILLPSFLLSTALFAADVRVGDVALHLPHPRGYCEMDPVLATDAPLVGRLHAAVAQSGNHLLVVSADCAELKEWRRGKRPDVEHMAAYQTMAALENRELPDTPENMIHNYCASMNALGDRVMPGTVRDVPQRAEMASALIVPNEVKLLGVLAEEPLACYAATLQRFKIEDREPTTQLSIIATTILRGKVVFAHLMAPYAGRAALAQLLATQRTNLTQLQRSNRN
jgi:hypothetical protein